MIEVTGATHIGKTHIENDMENQDAFCSIAISGTGKNGVLIAVADGHSSEAHKYSAAGSKIAIAITKSLFSVYLKSDSTAQPFLEKMSKIMLYQWQKGVLEYHFKHHSSEPFSFFLYGTTLRSVMVDEHLNAFVFSVGDGITALFDEKGEPSFIENSHLSSTDEPTASLCNAHLSDLKYSSVNLGEYSGILVATDGFDTFLNTAKNLKNHFNHRVMNSSGKKIQTNIENLSREYSETNNEDDSSIAIIKLREKLLPESLDNKALPEELAEKSS